MLLSNYNIYSEQTLDNQFCCLVKCTCNEKLFLYFCFGHCIFKEHCVMMCGIDPKHNLSFCVTIQRCISTIVQKSIFTTVAHRNNDKVALNPAVM